RKVCLRVQACIAQHPSTTRAFCQLRIQFLLVHYSCVLYCFALVFIGQRGKPEETMINRRDFLRSSSTFLAGLALNGQVPVRRGDQPAGASSPSRRMLLPINRNWRFSARQVEGATAAGFDDSGFEQVTIPHTNKRLPWHSFDDNAYQFVSVYRRRFRLP